MKIETIVKMIDNCFDYRETNHYALTNEEWQTLKAAVLAQQRITKQGRFEDLTQICADCITVDCLLRNVDISKCKQKTVKQ
jgi:hypothetical protein